MRLYSPEGEPKSERAPSDVAQMLYACVCVCVRACVCACACLYTYIGMRVGGCLGVPLHVRLQTCLHVFICVCDTHIKSFKSSYCFGCKGATSLQEFQPQFF